MAIVSKLKEFFNKYFLTGLFVIIPIWATYYVLTALLGVIDGLLGDLPRQFTGIKFPGMGILTLLLFILAVGMLTANFVGTYIVRCGESWLQRVPLVRGIYSTVKKVMETFSLKQNFHGVALIEYPRKGSYTVGFITGGLEGRSVGIDGPCKTVFIPTTPNITAGFLLILPETEVRRLDMTVDEGMKFVVSVGLVSFDEVTQVRRQKAPAQEPLS